MDKTLKFNEMNERREKINKRTANVIYFLIVYIFLRNMPIILKQIKRILRK